MPRKPKISQTSAPLPATPLHESPVLTLNDVDYANVTPNLTPDHHFSPSFTDTADPFTPTPHNLSPDELDCLAQLVNDNNHVGPGHDANVRPYVCAFDDCTKAFARKSDLARHFRIHTGDKPYMCGYRNCGKSFIQRSALTVHIRTHTGEKPHHCETCNKAFADSSSLARHRRIHTGKRPYSCPVMGCGRAFARRNTFLKHHKRTHPELSAPSTNPSRHPIHFAVPRNRRAFLGQSASGDEVYLSPPHGFAASQPPQGAAFSNSGGFGSQPTQPHLIANGAGFGGEGGRHGSGVGAGIGGNGSSTSSLHLSVATPIVIRTPSTAGLQTVHTPVSASSSFHDGSGFGSPAISFPDGSGTSAGGGMYEPHDSQGGGHGHPGGHVGYPHQPHPVFRSVWTHALPPPQPGMMWYRAGQVAPRSISSPVPPRAPYVSSAPYGNVAGFSANQLSIPVNNQPQVLSSYYQPPPVAQTHGPETRDGSPDLVDINAVPSINVEPTHTPPHVSVVAPQFSTVPQIQVPPPLPERLHSASPFLTRFHSSPQVPTVSSWGDFEPYSGPGGYGDAHSLGGGRSGEDEDWEELEEQMLSRDVSTGPDNEAQAPQGTPPVETPQEGESLPKTQWEAPITFPVNPRESSRVFSSAASVASTSSTLVNPSDPSAPSAGPPPLVIYPQQSVSPMIYTPVQDQGSFYPTPVTPWEPTPSFKGYHQQPLYHHYALQSPAVILPPRGAYAYQPTPSPVIPMQHSDVHNITLTTPPSTLERKNTSTTTVSAVGLGIANVHFGEHTAGLNGNLTLTPESDKGGLLSEGDDDESMEGCDAGEESDSDDEFLPGGRGKAKKRLGSAKKKSRSFTMKPRRRLLV